MPHLQNGHAGSVLEFWWEANEVMNMGAKSLPSCLTLCDTMDCSPPASSVCGDSPGKNTEVACHALLQGIF